MANVIYAFAGLAVFGLLMLWMGYRLGVQHTEARWSDAVGKMHDVRRRVIRAYDAGQSKDLWHAIDDLKTFA